MQVDYTVPGIDADVTFYALLYVIIRLGKLALTVVVVKYKYIY